MRVEHLEHLSLLSATCGMSAACKVSHEIVRASWERSLERRPSDREPHAERSLFVGAKYKPQGTDRRRKKNPSRRALVCLPSVRSQVKPCDFIPSCDSRVQAP